MDNNSRIKNSLFNMASGFIYRILIMLTSFAVRTVFIKCLASDYLGVNGLYTSILSILSLVELGFGTAMVYSMYRPLAQGDHQKLKLLMQLYKKVYSIIGTVILVIGLCLIPFLKFLIKDAPDVQGLTFYYILFLLDTVTTYWFFAYKSSLLQADQKAYIISGYNSAFNIIKSTLQIVLLLCFRSYTIYLVTQIICTAGQNIALAIKVNRLYPALKERGADGEKLPKAETTRIFKDVKALMLSRVSHVVLNSTDNVIISAIIGIGWVGLLSNFIMIAEAVTGLLTQITSAIQAGLGNFFAKEDREAGYRLFCRVEFMNFWLYGFSTIALITLLNPFVTLWLGDDYTMGEGVIVAFGINFLVAGYMNTLWTFRSTLGLFTQGQYRPLIVSVLNVVLSFGLGFRWGVAGVLAATSISRACVNLWYDPWLLHKEGFGKPVKPYYVKFVLRLLLLAVLVLGMKYLSSVVFNGGVQYLNFFIMMCLVALIPNAVFLALFHQTDEFNYYKDLARGWLRARKR
ncbi:MAG TPA: sugar translocase [Bacillota bacterium]|nr:sugar translocase [Bacillota bacterium]